MADVSIMIQKLEGCLGTECVNPDESRFIEDMVALLEAGQVTSLTPKQVGYLTSIHDRHFA